MKDYLLEYKPSLCLTRMVVGRRPGYLTYVESLTSLWMLVACGSGDTIDYVSYMAEEATWQYFKSFCEAVSPKQMVADGRGARWNKTSLQREVLSSVRRFSGLFRTVLEKLPGAGQGPIPEHEIMDDVGANLFRIVCMHMHTMRNMVRLWPLFLALERL